jgi:hypothetical protein
MGCMPELKITSPYVVARVDSNNFSMGIGKPFASVDLSPLPESTLSPSQGLRIWRERPNPKKNMFYGTLCRTTVV